MIAIDRGLGNNTGMLSEFFFSLIGGIFAVIATGRLDQIAWRFLRTVGALQAALTVFALVWIVRFQTVPASMPAWLIYGIAVVVVLASFGIMFFSPIANHRRLFFRGLCVSGAVGALVIAAVYAAMSVPVEATSGLIRAGAILSRVFGALLIGSITVAWLLGHAYLTATRMTIAPLRHFSKLLSWSVVFRMITVIISIGVAWWMQDSYGAAARLTDSWLVLSLRIGVGLLALAIFAYMVADCVKLRSTQSATGILYFGSVFAYVGELASQHLVTACAWPL